MKDFGFIIKNKGMVKCGLKTDAFIMEILKMIKFKEKEKWSLVMGIFIKVISRMKNFMDLVKFQVKMVNNN